MRSLWKRLPEPVRRRCNEGVQALGRALLPIPVALRWRRGTKATEPVIVAGFHEAVIGLGQGARLFTQALLQGGFKVETLEVGAVLSGPPRLRRFARGSTSTSVLVTHLNPPELERYLIRTGASVLRGRRHVGYWAWEASTAPRNWRRAFRYVDEVWCPSAFTAQALRAIAPAHVPIRVVHHPMFMTPRPPSDRGRFALPQDACVVLQAFDLRSTAARKNPFGALDAYLAAVPRGDGSACLVCKVVGSESSAAIFSDLQARIATRPDLILIAETLSAQDMLSLVASADIVLSLHRGEGFGLLLAEAMWLGKPVVATGWSGNMDFMDSDCAALIDWTLVTAHDPQNMYDGMQWADPDPMQAAEALRRLIGDPDARHALGRRGRTQAERVFSSQAWFRQVRSALCADGVDQADLGRRYPVLDVQ